MAENKARDDKYFNCAQEHEIEYVVSFYPDHGEEVREFLKKKCADNGNDGYLTHEEIHELIKKELDI